MSSRAFLPASWAIAAAAMIAACGGGEGPAAPGGRNGVILRYVTPRLQVVATGENPQVEIALEIRRETTPPESEPWADAPLRIARTAGQGALSSTRVVTDANGVARFSVTMPGGTDKTAIVVSLEADSDSYLPFDVVSAPVLTVDLEPGEVLHLDPPRDGVILRFAPAAATARWTLVPYSTDLERGGAPYRFFHQPPVVGAGAATFGAETTVVPFAAPLPGEQRGDAMTGADVDPGPLVPSANVPLALSTKSCATGVDRMAPLRYLGERVAIYVDDDEAVHQARIDSLGAAFDDHISPTNTQAYGPTTDLDGNGVVYAILTPAVPGGAYCDSVRRLRVEAFYATWSPSVRIEALMALMAHEHQHVIHSGIRIQRQDDALWLNEALSLAAEAVNGYWYAALPRVWLFLNGQNTGLTMLERAYSRSFDDKYMMLLLYLRDRFGNDFFARLEVNPRSDVANVENTTGLPFEIVLRDWFVASGVSGRGAVDDPAYTYRTVDLHGMAAEATACGCLPVQRLDGMRLEPLTLGAGFDAFRTLASADADYYEVAGAAASVTRDVYFDAYGRTSVNLSVVRTH